MSGHYGLERHISYVRIGVLVFLGDTHDGLVHEDEVAATSPTLMAVFVSVNVYLVLHNERDLLCKYCYGAQLRFYQLIRLSAG